MSQWYEESFGREYLELYAHRDVAEARADIEAIVRLIDPPWDEPLLDLCCGACRHLLILREMGFSQLVGLDLSAELLEVGAQALTSEGGEASGSEATGGEASECVLLVCSDMRAIPYEDHFATVLSLFTSFGYFERDEENQAVLEAVFKALRPGGMFLIDYLNRDHVIAHLVERDEQVLPGWRIQHVRCLTEGCRRVEKTTTVIADDGAPGATLSWLRSAYTYRESVRMYSADEMEGMLRAAGFVHIRRYGTLAGQAFGPQSARLILVAEKNEQDVQD